MRTLTAPKMNSWCLSTMAPSVIVPVLCVALAAIIIAVIPKHKREASANWLSAHLPLLPRGHRTSESKTPPRSQSPEKKVPSNTPPLADYKDIFPPFQRNTLPKVAESYPQVQKSKLLGGNFNETEFNKNIIPFTTNYRDCGPSTYTPMGFSMEEISTVGDFPDYAELSGVPLPEPYKEFKIETACARPYRPFRWAYHQTMCKFPPAPNLFSH